MAPGQTGLICSGSQYLSWFPRKLALLSVRFIGGEMALRSCSLKGMNCPDGTPGVDHPRRSVRFDKNAWRREDGIYPAELERWSTSATSVLNLLQGLVRFGGAGGLPECKLTGNSDLRS